MQQTNWTSGCYPTLKLLV